MGRPARVARLRERSASRGPFAAAPDRKLASCALACRDAPIRWAAVRLPPTEVETYLDSDRPRLRLSWPPDVAKRVKLLRAEVNRALSPAAGIGGKTGAAGIEGVGIAGTGFVGRGTTGGVGGVGRVGAGGCGVPSPPLGTHEGIRGVLPPDPPNEFEVPISVPLACGF